jgi:hypothetical protein
MSDDLRADLTRMLDQYDERLRADAAREKKTREDDASFLESFAELRRAVVRPVFEAAGAMLAERGHGFEISERQFAADAGGKVREAGISLRIAPAGMAAQLHAEDHERSLSITTRHYNKTVWISAGRSLEAGGMAGAKGACALKQVDRQLVEEQVVRLVASVMGRG